MSIEDDLIESYGHKLQDIYENRTAGAFTWVGVLATFLLDVDKAREGVAKAPESPVEPLKRYFVSRYLIPSFSGSSETYQVEEVIDRIEGDTTWRCQCPAYRFLSQPGTCKHIDHVQFANGGYGARPIHTAFSFDTDTYVRVDQ